MSFRLLLLIFLFFGPLITQVSATVFVVDGDTLSISDTTYRLYGIDAPEAGQTCRGPKGMSWPCGQAAVKALKTLTAKGDIHCEAKDEDRYNRVIAICRAQGLDLGEAMVRQGFAWAYLKFSKRYEAIESEARWHGRGVFANDPVRPWEFRQRRWSNGQAQNGECPIKGNISRSGEKIYHAPWSPWYSRTKISTGRGEHWFCDEREALNAGWRAPIWGR